MVIYLLSFLLAYNNLELWLLENGESCFILRKKFLLCVMW